MEEWHLDVDPVLLEAYEMAMAEIRGEDLSFAALGTVTAAEVRAYLARRVQSAKPLSARSLSQPCRRFGPSTAGLTGAWTCPMRP